MGIKKKAGFLATLAASLGVPYLAAEKIMKELYNPVTSVVSENLETIQQYLERLNEASDLASNSVILIVGLVAIGTVVTSAGALYLYYKNKENRLGY